MCAGPPTRSWGSAAPEPGADSFSGLHSDPPPIRPWSVDGLGLLIRSRWWPLVLAAAAVVLSYCVQRWVYPYHSWNRDELTYLWQVDVLRSGRLAAPDGGFPDLVRPFLTATGDGTIFSQYPVGWPLPILLADLIASPGMALWGATVLVVLGVRALALELYQDRLVAGLAGLLALASPILVLHSGTYLNYLFTLGLGTWFVVAVSSGLRTRSRGRLVVAGALVGWIFLTRPYDAIIWGLLGAGWVLVDRLWSAPAAERRNELGLLAVGVGAALPFVAAQLWINQRLGGSPLEFAMTSKDPLDTFGFGDRRIMPRFPTVSYAWGLPFTSAARNVFWMPFFLVGAHLGGVVAAVSVWVRRHDARTWFLVTIGAAFPLAYLVFWGNHIASMIARLNGPIYLIPAYAPLCILIALQLVRLRRRRPQVTWVLVAVLVVASLVSTGNRLWLNRQLSLAQEPWGASVAGLDEPAIVLVSTADYLLYLNPVGSNPPDLDGDILYVTDTSADLIDLMAQHPDRIVVQQEASLSEAQLIPSEHPASPTVVLRPIEIVSGRVVEITMRVEATEDPVVEAFLTTGHETIHRTLRVDAEPGERVEVTWRIAPGAPGSVLTDGPLVSIPPTAGQIAVGVGHGATVDEARRLPGYQHRWWARTRAGTLEIVTPGRSFGRAEDSPEDAPNWLELFEPTTFSVELVATAG